VSPGALNANPHPLFPFSIIQLSGFSDYGANNMECGGLPATAGLPPPCGPNPGQIGAKEAASSGDATFLAAQK
jgi:hypothetical protein